MENNDNANVDRSGSSKNEDDQHGAGQSNEQQSDKGQSKPASENEVNFNTPTKEISEPQSEGQTDSTHSENSNSLQEFQGPDEDDTHNTNRFHAL